MFDDDYDDEDIPIECPDCEGEGCDEDGWTCLRCGGEGVI